MTQAEETVEAGGDELPETITAEFIEGLKDRKSIDAVAEELNVSLLARDTIKQAKEKLVAAITPEQEESGTGDTEDQAPPPNKLPGKLPKGFRGTTRRIRNTNNGRVFVWTEALSRQPGMVEVTD